MQTRQRLLQRLDAIGVSLSGSSTALALLALGSVGVETERLDEYFLTLLRSHSAGCCAPSSQRWMMPPCSS
jgi:hypothetical protein